MAEKTGDLDIRIASTIEKLIQVQRVLLWDIAKKEKLSPIQIQFMIFLNTRPSELRRVSCIAEEFDLTKATVSDAVSNLAEKGLVGKVNAEKDKRSYMLELTTAGVKLAEKIGGWQKSIIKNLRHIPYEEKETAYHFLTGLIKSLFDDGVISVARMCLTCGNLQTGGRGRPNTCGLTGRTFDDNNINFNCNSFRTA